MNHVSALVLHPYDNVAVALAPLTKGQRVVLAGSPVIKEVTVQADIPSGHKIALCALSPGQTVIKYGQPIGVVTTDIRVGDHVHVHNLDSTRKG